MNVQITGKNITKKFSNHTVLKNINIDLSSGDAIHVLGSNGQGKTTLVKLLAGVINPTSGRIDFFLQDQKLSKRSVLKILGYIPSSENNFFGRLTGRQNLIYFLSLYGLKKGDINKKIDCWSDEFSALRKAIETPYYLCSTGMKKQLSLCRGLLHEPSVVIADEPFSGLDDQSIQTVEKMLNKRSKDSILILSHNGFLPVEISFNNKFVLKEGALTVLNQKVRSK